MQFAGAGSERRDLRGARNSQLRAALFRIFEVQAVQPERSD
jgi:hypothetical protein